MTRMYEEGDAEKSGFRCGRRQRLGEEAYSNGGANWFGEKMEENKGNGYDSVRGDKTEPTTLLGSCLPPTPIVFSRLFLSFFFSKEEK